jgi:hypothetical protein
MKSGIAPEILRNSVFPLKFHNLKICEL